MADLLKSVDWQRSTDQTNWSTVATTTGRTTITSSHVVPLKGSTVLVLVVDASWMIDGRIVFEVGGGSYQIVSHTTISAVLRYMDVDFNGRVGQTVPSGSQILEASFDDTTPLTGTTYWRAFENTDLTTLPVTNMVHAGINVTPGNTVSAMQFGGVTVLDKCGVIAIKFNLVGEMLVLGFILGTAVIGGQTIVGLNGTSTGPWMAKFNAAGTLIWLVNLTDPLANITGSGFTIDSNGDIGITGSFSGRSKFGGPTELVSTNLDIFVLKLNGSTGAFMNVVKFGSVTDDAGFGISADFSGNFYATGFYNNTINWGGSAGSTTSSGFENCFVLKLNTNLVSQWVRSFGTSGGTRGLSIDTDTDGNTVLAGYRVETNGNKTLFIRKYNATGTQLWEVLSASAGSSVFGPNCIRIAPNGQIVVTGYFFGVAASVGGSPNIQPAGNTSAIFVAKLSTGGTVSWARAFGGDFNSTDGGLSCAQDASGNVYVTGFVRNVIDFGGGILYNSPLTVDVFFLKMPPDGNWTNGVSWASRPHGPTDADAGNCVIVDEAANQIVFAGKFTGSMNFGPDVGILRAGTGSTTHGWIARVWI